MAFRLGLFFLLTTMVPAHARDLLVVAAGGLISCSTQGLDGRRAETTTMAPFILSMRNRMSRLGYLGSSAETPVRFHYFFTCHKWEERLHYLTSEPGSAPRAGFLPQVVDEIDAMARRLENPKLVVIGHSAGGWIAMKIALALEGRRFVDYLVTLDAISWRTCRIGRLEKCDASPPDIIPTDRRRIADNTGWWDNFYQTHTRILHATAIAEADRNIAMNVRHIPLKEYAVVWTRVQEKLEDILRSERIRNSR